jgi:hypothetical protein
MTRQTSQATSDLEGRLVQRRFRDSPFLAHQARPAFDPYLHDYSPPRSHVAGGLHPAVPTHDGDRTSGRNEDAS